MAEPLLSVVVPVYNHAPYIEECLRSIAAQEVDFPMEVIVGEDGSTDNTREVLRRIEPELPDHFKIIYREKNLGAVGNGEDLYARARGKYLAEIEGDDFYLYPHKLQRQVDFLESHSDYVATYTNCIVVGADSRPNGERYPECPDDEYSFREYFYWCLPGQTGTIVCRREEYLTSRQQFLDMRQFQTYAGDRRNSFVLLTQGRVLCFQERWSAYRHIRKGGSSHSANVRKDRSFAENEVGFGRTLVAYAERYGDAEAIKVAKMTCYRMRFRWSHGPSKIEGVGSVLRDALAERGMALSCATSSLRWYAGLLLRVLQGHAII